jgi:hypothetical protein
VSLARLWRWAAGGLQWRPGRRPPQAVRIRTVKLMHEALLRVRSGTLDLGVSGFRGFTISGIRVGSRVFFRGFGPADADVRLHPHDTGSLRRLAFPDP